MDELLVQLVSVAKAEYGEAEYAYFKKRIGWRSARKRGQRGSHFMPIGDGTPIDKAEYEANLAESKRIGLEAFMGRWQRDYWQYDRKLTKPGWREKLVEIINGLPDSASEGQ